MKGYKIFVRYSNKDPWKGPYRALEKGWSVRAGAILETKEVCKDNDVTCGKGINFWVDKRSAYSHYAYISWIFNIVAVYEVESLSKCYGSRTIKRSTDNKKRCRKLKLVRKLKNPKKELSNE